VKILQLKSTETLYL